MLQIKVQSLLLVSINPNVTYFFRYRLAVNRAFVHVRSPLRALSYLRQHNDGADAIYIDQADYHPDVLARTRNILRSQHPEINLVFIARSPSDGSEALKLGDLLYTIPERITA